MSTEAQDETDQPLDPEKLIRIASLTREVLEEVRKMQPEDSTNEQLATLHSRVKTQLRSALPKVLADELEDMQLDFPFGDGATTNEVRIAYSGLLGWLGGLFQGLQASAAQAMIQQQQQQRLIEPAEEQAQPRPKEEGYL